MSLVTTPTSQLGTCYSCGGSRLTSITMMLTDGSVVDFSSCHGCEHKRWAQAGTQLDVRSVLAKAQKHKTPQ